jgi:hypothetical protein
MVWSLFFILTKVITYPNLLTPVIHLILNLKSSSLEDYSTLLLKDVAIQTGFIDLIAIPLSEPHQEFLILTNPRNPKKPLVLTFSNESKIELNIDDLTGHWLERAITTGKEKLTEEQLLEFFWFGPWATFGFFHIKLLSNHMIILWP